MEGSWVAKKGSVNVRGLNVSNKCRVIKLIMHKLKADIWCFQQAYVERIDRNNNKKYMREQMGRLSLCS